MQTAQLDDSLAVKQPTNSRVVHMGRVKGMHSARYSRTTT